MMRPALSSRDSMDPEQENKDFGLGIDVGSSEQEPVGVSESSWSPSSEEGPSEGGDREGVGEPPEVQSDGVESREEQDVGKYASEYGQPPVDSDGLNVWEQAVDSASEGTGDREGDGEPPEVRSDGIESQEEQDAGDYSSEYGQLPMDSDGLDVWEQAVDSTSEGTNDPAGLVAYRGGVEQQVPVQNTNDGDVVEESEFSPRTRERLEYEYSRGYPYYYKLPGFSGRVIIVSSSDVEPITRQSTDPRLRSRGRRSRRNSDADPAVDDHDTPPSRTPSHLGYEYYPAEDDVPRRPARPEIYGDKLPDFEVSLPAAKKPHQPMNTFYDDIGDGRVGFGEGNAYVSAPVPRRPRSMSFEELQQATKRVSTSWDDENGDEEFLAQFTNPDASAPQENSDNIDNGQVDNTLNIPAEGSDTKEPENPTAASETPRLSSASIFEANQSPAGGQVVARLPATNGSDTPAISLSLVAQGKEPAREQDDQQTDARNVDEFLEKLTGMNLQNAIDSYEEHMDRLERKVTQEEAEEALIKKKSILAWEQEVKRQKEGHHRSRKLFHVPEDPDERSRLSRLLAHKYRHESRQHEQHSDWLEEQIRSRDAELEWVHRGFQGAKKQVNELNEHIEELKRRLKACEKYGAVSDSSSPKCPQCEKLKEDLEVEQGLVESLGKHWQADQKKVEMLQDSVKKWKQKAEQLENELVEMEFHQEQEQSAKSNGEQSQDVEKKFETPGENVAQAEQRCNDMRTQFEGDRQKLHEEIEQLKNSLQSQPGEPPQECEKKCERIQKDLDERYKDLSEQHNADRQSLQNEIGRLKSYSKRGTDGLAPKRSPRVWQILPADREDLVAVVVDWVNKTDTEERRRVGPVQLDAPLVEKIFGETGRTTFDDVVGALREAGFMFREDRLAQMLEPWYTARRLTPPPAIMFAARRLDLNDGSISQLLEEINNLRSDIREAERARDRAYEGLDAAAIGERLDDPSAEIEMARSAVISAQFDVREANDKISALETQLKAALAEAEKGRMYDELNEEDETESDEGMEILHSLIEQQAKKIEDLETAAASENPRDAFIRDTKRIESLISEALKLRAEISEHESTFKQFHNDTVELLEGKDREIAALRDAMPKSPVSSTPSNTSSSPPGPSLAPLPAVVKTPILMGSSKPRPHLSLSDLPLDPQQINTQAYRDTKARLQAEFEERQIDEDRQEALRTSVLEQMLGRPLVYIPKAERDAWYIEEGRKVVGNLKTKA